MPNLLLFTMRPTGHTRLDIPGYGKLGRECAFRMNCTICKTAHEALIAKASKGVVMADFQLSKKDMEGLEKDLQQKFKKAEVEANNAAARESTPQGKARAFAKVLKKHGIKDVNEAELRRKFKT